MKIKEKKSNLKISELPNFKELTTSETSEIIGGITVSKSINLSPVATAYLLGTSPSGLDGGVYTVTYENGKLSDSLAPVPTLAEGTLPSVLAKTGIFF